MNDSKNNRRPNANYKLSGENADPDEIVYHYNRERRLQKAPQAVQDLYKPQPPHRFNLLRPLVSTRPLAMLFATVVVTALLVLVVSILGLAGNSYDLDGNQVSVQAFQYEGAIIVMVKKNIKKSGFGRLANAALAYTGAVDIAIQPVIKDGAEQEPQELFYHKIFFTHEPEEMYRFSVPFDTGELAIVFKTETKTRGLTVKVE